MTTYHMSPDAFRKNGYALIDWIAGYMESVENLPVQSTVRPGEIRGKIPESAPEAPEPFDALLADLDSVVMPGVTHWQSPNWFAYFPANSSPPAVLGELAAAGLAVQGMLWSTSPAATEVESAVLDWLVDLMGLPQSWKMSGPGGGVIQMSASDSTHAALVVARHNTDVPIDRQVIYASSQAHSSIEKGARIAGFSHVRLVEVDRQFALDPAALSKAIERDIESGLTPVFVVSALGTTGTGAVDPIGEIGRLARKFGLWHHVDAAWAGNVMICPEFRCHQPDLSNVDSYTVNPHKWMFTNFDCNVFWVADRGPLLETLSILPPYLRNAASDSGEVVDYRDWHVPLGRRFRALKLWWVLRSYGAEGIRHHIREHIRMAQALSARLQSDSRFEVISPTDFALVCFRHVDGDESTNRIAEKINASGRAMLTASRIDDRAFVRVSVGQTRTEQRHVDALWEMIDDFA
ncbi:MAG: aspartate aminotransferase family protein [Pseudomonadota bacterium]|nr:MAG: aspartate aminotransferase family protein [Pseudomonadota bacterium]